MRYNKSLTQNYEKLLPHMITAVFISNALLAVKLNYNYAKVRKQGKFLADIVERNQDRLNEFDVIALINLGVITNPEDIKWQEE